MNYSVPIRTLAIVENVAMFETLMITLLVGALGVCIIWRDKRKNSTRSQRWQATATLGASLAVMFFLGNTV